jgi:hypothetical protein
LATLPLKKHIKNKGKSNDIALLKGYLVSNEVWQRLEIRIGLEDAELFAGLAPGDRVGKNPVFF